MSTIGDTASRGLIVVPPKAYRRDQEFLPAALEILEMPPSPIRMYLLIAICAFVSIALAWTYFGRIDIISAAHGKIQPTGRVKVVQPLETGKIKTIYVQNGMHVSAGEVLAELDATEARAQAAAAQSSLSSFRAEVVRRKAAIEAVGTKPLSADQPITHPTIAWSSEIPLPIRAREGAVLDGDLSQLEATLSGIESQILQKRIEAQSLETTIAAQKDLIGVLQDRAAMREALLVKQVGSKADWLDTAEKVKTQQVTLSSERGQLADARASIETLHRDWTKARRSFVADNAQKLNDAERQVDELSQKLRQAQSQLDHMTLRSPIDGIVQGSSLTTVGQVVTTGLELMRIVPTGSRIDIEAYLPNSDIGFIEVGQHADVKIEAFPFTRYGTVSGKIVRIATDAIPEPEARQIEGDPAHSAGPSSNLIGGGQQTQNLVFPIIVELERDTITADGKAVSLSPGMAVTVEIKTGKRRILEYLFSPVVEVTSDAMRER